MATQKNSKKGNRPFKAPLRKVGIKSVKVNYDTLVVTFWRRQTTATKAGIKTGPSIGRPAVQRIDDKNPVEFNCESEDYATLLAQHVLKMGATTKKSGLVYQIRRLVEDPTRFTAATMRSANRRVYRGKMKVIKEERRRREEARLLAMQKRSGAGQQRP